MTEITNDIHFREVLNGLSLAEQRSVGAEFINLVISLSDDDRIDFAVRMANNNEATESELAAAFKAAKAAALDSHTRCGADADWSEQAGYFVARAASAIVAPEKSSRNENPAWNAAVNCRMAHTCTMIESNTDEEPQESEKQYRILEQYMNP
jgi:hypothetical protein